MSNARVVPYFCPYCADEDLRPWAPSEPEETTDPHPANAEPKAVRGAWHCTSCTRVFTVAFQGMVIPNDVTNHPST
ncbi:hypothetical protein [Natronoglycomyces albus]|uniref:Insertion element protein n=1 Tax=Natronoglycomyces albus TaxID=2811108 RepID=A0A895XQ92_9ACTN|nr:hypothetical protein [Natronoglycomyces albus]QSB04440.1 hypothetical protein JQS30_11650 [Natronoglycomyces albus]